MDSVLRTVAVYGFLLVVFRIVGKRSLAQITSFDFVLLLIVGEATQQALLGDDFSLTTAGIVIATLMVLELALSFIKEYSQSIDRLMESTPVIIVEHGKLLQERLERERVDLSDIMQAARERHGVERLDQIKYAVLERSGGISIIVNDK
jgi:uncharacterized membrane protein YcaP (DUF421 family)